MYFCDTISWSSSSMLWKKNYLFHRGLQVSGKKTCTLITFFHLLLLSEGSKQIFIMLYLEVYFLGNVAKAGFVISKEVVLTVSDFLRTVFVNSHYNNIQTVYFILSISFFLYICHFFISWSQMCIIPKQKSSKRAFKRTNDISRNGTPPPSQIKCVCS